MWLNFAAVIAALGANAAFRIANTARAAGDYLFASLLPERNMFGYTVESGNMTIRATMAGLVGMDSPYPPGGNIEVSTFMERTAKIANEVTLTEQALRTIQEMVMRLQINGAPTNEVLQNEVLNFLDKAVIQPHLDRMEWLRGQALQGAISWEFAGKQLTVDYGFPSANKPAQRTGTAGYGGNASVLWADIRLARRLLRNRVRAFIAHSDTIDMVRYNPQNSLVSVSEINGAYTFRRLVSANGQLSEDTGDNFTLVAYDGEGDIINPANPDEVIHVPFMPRGVILAVGQNGATGYRVGQGSATENPNQSVALGYTHIAPTVEGGGQPGRWAQLYTPEMAPWELHGRGVTNGLPVIEGYDKVVVLRTEMT